MCHDTKKPRSIMIFLQIYSEAILNEHRKTNKYFFLKRIEKNQNKLGKIGLR